MTQLRLSFLSLCLLPGLSLGLPLVARRGIGQEDAGQDQGEGKLHGKLVGDIFPSDLEEKVKERKKEKKGMDRS